MKFLAISFFLLLNLNFYAENVNTTTLRTEKKQSDLIKKIKYKLIYKVNKSSKSKTCYGSCCS